VDKCLWKNRIMRAWRFYLVFSIFKFLEALPRLQRRNIFSFFIFLFYKIIALIRIVDKCLQKNRIMRAWRFYLVFIIFKFLEVFTDFFYLTCFYKIYCWIFQLFFFDYSIFKIWFFKEVLNEKFKFWSFSLLRYNGNCWSPT
jgi:hypothetical protein